MDVVQNASEELLHRLRSTEPSTSEHFCMSTLSWESCCAYPWKVGFSLRPTSHIFRAADFTGLILLWKLLGIEDWAAALPAAHPQENGTAQTSAAMLLSQVLGAGEW